ncbi:FtsW/RodA/SpoVE family cell cycle protein [bacterium]|nr:FtsW/RodA/SpoVE family cell cycle protein [bacterium]
MNASALAASGSRAMAREKQLRFWIGRLLVAVLLLLCAGLAAGFSTTVYLRLARGLPPYTAFLEQCQFVLIGLGVSVFFNILVARFSPARRWLRYAIPLAFFASLILLALVRLSPWGVMENGARRWLDLGFITFQPSELLKISLVLYLGQLLCWWRRPPGGAGFQPEMDGAALRGGVHNGGQSARPTSTRPTWPALPKRCMVIIFLALAFTASQPDLGSSGIILGSSIITLILAGVSWRPLLGFILMIALLGGLAMTAVPNYYSYAAKRVETWLNPTANNDSAAYQITQSRGALAEGGLWGRGFLKSEQKMNRLPLSTKDFVFPVMVEELGFAGGLLIILLFVNLAWVAVRLAGCCRDPFNRTVIAALGFTIALQALVNIATTTGTLPLSGLTLPFFSVGGTSMVVSLFAVGTMVALGRSELLGKETGRRA